MELKLNTAVGNTTPAAGSRKVGEASAEPLTASQARQQAREDRIELSRQAVEYLQGKTQQAEEAAEKPLTEAEKKHQEKLEQMKSIQQMLDAVRQQGEQMRKQTEQQGKALKEAMETMKRCGKIATNISKGLKVPPKDIQYLIETDPNQYLMAMALRMMEEAKKKKAKSELKDEEQERSEENGSVEAAGGVESAGDAAVDASATGDQLTTGQIESIDG